MQAFLTGSRAYGTPREDSDIDLVIRCDKETAEILENHKENLDAPVKYGKLNLIIARDDDEYRAWQVGTKALIRQKPISKDVAKPLFLSIWPNNRLTECSPS